MIIRHLLVHYFLLDDQFLQQTNPYCAQSLKILCGLLLKYKEKISSPFNSDIHCTLPKSVSFGWNFPIYLFTKRGFLSLLLLFGDPGFFRLKYIKTVSKSCFLVLGHVNILVYRWNVCGFSNSQSTATNDWFY